MHTDSTSPLKPTVLFVDDSPFFRQQVVSVLTAQGYDCDWAADGLEALRRVVEKQYDAIVTDIEMPGLDGLKFVHRLRLGGRNKGTPVIVVSSANQKETVVRALGLGVQGYLLKPLFPEDLIDKLEILRAGISGQDGG